MAKNKAMAETPEETPKNVTTPEEPLAKPKPATGLQPLTDDEKIELESLKKIEAGGSLRQEDACRLRTLKARS